MTFCVAGQSISCTNSRPLPMALESGGDSADDKYSSRDVVIF